MRWMALLKSLTIVMILTVLTVVVLLALAIHQRNRAQAFLQQFSKLRSGVSTFMDAEQITHQYNGKPWEGSQREPTCSSQKCNLRFVFKNNPLSYLPWVRKVEFISGITVQDGYVFNQEIDYTILANTWTNQFTYILDDGLKSDGPKDFSVKELKRDALGIPHVLRVDLGPMAASAKRKDAYSLDLSCLAKFRGCDTGSSIFPVAVVSKTTADTPAPYK